MVMGIGRPYRTKMRLFQGSQETQWVRWYRCSPTALDFPYYSRFGSGGIINNPENGDWSKIGEVKGAPRQRIPDRVNKPPGICFVGKREWYAEGIPLRDRNNYQAVPFCCDIRQSFLELLHSIRSIFGVNIKSEIGLEHGAELVTIPSGHYYSDIQLGHNSTVQHKTLAKYKSTITFCHISEILNPYLRHCESIITYIHDSDNVATFIFEKNYKSTITLLHQVISDIQVTHFSSIITLLHDTEVVATSEGAFDVFCDGCIPLDIVQSQMTLTQTFYPDGPSVVVLDQVDDQQAWNYWDDSYYTVGIPNWPGLKDVAFSVWCIDGKLQFTLFLENTSYDDFGWFHPVSGECGNLVFNIPAGIWNDAGTATITFDFDSAGEVQGVGTVTATSTASAVGSAVKTSVGSAEAESTASAVGLTIKDSVGSATGEAVSSAEGSAIKDSVGSAEAEATASAVGLTLKDSVGTASGEAVSSAVGSSIKSSVGTASADSTASAVGSSIKSSVGTASADSTASAVADLGVMTTVTFLSSGSWLCPTGVNMITAECWGAGGGGINKANGTVGGGGGGGAYSKKTGIGVTPGNTYNYTVGVGGASGISGGDTQFQNSTVCVAKGGTSSTTLSNGLGGASGSGVGTVKFSGGAGGAGQQAAFTSGGGGGSSAGTAANGVVGQAGSILGSGATAPSGGGNGGDSWRGARAATPGAVPGGGGGGQAAGTTESESGGNGKIVLTNTT